MHRVQRMLATLAGDRIDRAPVVFWRHFPGDDMSAEDLAGATLAFWRKFDWDFINLVPRNTYCAEDWGNKYRFRKGSPPKLTTPAVASAADWARIRPLTGTVGTFGEQIEALKLVKKEVASEALVLMNVYSPISVACQLCGSVSTLMRHLRQNREGLLSALDAISLTLGRFADACIAAGASGIFLSTTEIATYQLLTDDEYDEVGREFDLRVLNSVRGALFNVLHVCQSNNMLLKLLDYPVHAFSWDATDRTNASLADVRKATGRALIGGLDEGETLVSGGKRALRAQVMSAFRETSCRKWILSGGCVLDEGVTEKTLRYLRKLSEELKPARG